MKPQKRNYIQSVQEQSAQASSGFAAEISKLASELEQSSKGIADSTVRAANVSRIIGLELSAWLNREQMKFAEFESFFRKHAQKLPKWLDSAAARKFISIHKAHPDEITDLKTAVQVVSQMTFFALGLMEEPVRLLQQTASGIGAFEKMVLLWGKEREALQKLKEEMPTERWDEKIWFTVRHQTEEAAKLHALAVEKLKGGRQ